MGDYFPGNIQLFDTDITELFSAGTLASAIAGYQLIFGAGVGFEFADRGTGIIDPNSPDDYNIVRDNRGNIIWIEDKVGALDDVAPRFIREQPGETLLGILLASAFYPCYR